MNKHNSNAIRRSYTITVTIIDATEEEADEVREELGGAIEDARDSGIWSDPVMVVCGELEPAVPALGAAP
jgi:hypothetical protein